MTPTTSTAGIIEKYFGVYEQVLGFNTSIYHEPTALELNFAVSERAQIKSGKLIFDFSKEIR